MKKFNLVRKLPGKEEEDDGKRPKRCGWGRIKIGIECLIVESSLTCSQLLEFRNPRFLLASNVKTLMIIYGVNRKENG